MPCYHPLPAWQSSSGDIFFAEQKCKDVVRTLDLPCGRCVGCRLEYSRQWAMRCLHESKLHKQNCFITLTYDDEHLPRDMSLDYRVFQLFMKRLRKYFSPKPVRFYMCGEYGEQFDRPHFHACLFGVDFPDKLLIRGSRRENALYRSAVLESLWPYGYSSIGEVNFESAAYVARYLMKKVNGDLAESHYRYVDLETGEIFQRTPEFAKMSLKPGIGAGWFDRFKSDVYPHDYVVVRGRKVKPPKFYDKLNERADPLGHEVVEYRRALDSRKRVGDNTYTRLAVKEVCAKARVDQFKRKI